MFRGPVLTEYSPDLDRYLERTSALELARRSLVGAPVYAVVSLIILFGTPIITDYGIWAIAEASLLIMLGILRIWFALDFERRYSYLGERAVLQFSILTMLQSLTFGVMAAMVIWKYWATQEAVLTVVLATGCIAAGTSALSVRRSANFIFLACVLAPLCLSVLLVGGLTKALLILGFLLLMALLVQDGGQARRLYADHLRSRFEADLRQNGAAIEDQARKDFLKEFGHEIRTPVTSIMGMTALLRNENLGARASEFVEIIRHASEGLEQLVDSVPGAVRSRPDIKSTSPVSISPAVCLRKLAALYQPQARHKGIELRTQFSDLPPKVQVADVNYLEQVITNLLDNAVRYTQHGSVTLSASCCGQSKSGLVIDVAVSDTGPGIPAEEMTSLLVLSGATGARISGKQTGGGLGLPIAKGLVDLLGGELKVKSTVGEGTEVSFKVCAELDPVSSAWKPSPKILMEQSLQVCFDLSRDHPHRILVAEHNRVNRHILCQFLSNLGYQVDEAEDGQMAVAAALRGDYDLIFMDLRMPVMNGIEATRWIRQLGPGQRNLRIVAVTGGAAVETREQCFAAGMNDFIAKPIHPDGLEAILRRNTAQAA